MNSKKAKRIRQLVQHLQERGAVGVGEWSVYGQQKHPDKTVLQQMRDMHTTSVSNVKRVKVQPTVMLDPACGKAIYKQMKKRSFNHGKV